MFTFKRTVLAGALMLASMGLGLGTIGCTDTNDSGKLPPASDGAADSAPKTDGGTGTGGAAGGGAGGAAGGGAGGAAGAADSGAGGTAICLDAAAG